MCVFATIVALLISFVYVLFLSVWTVWMYAHPLSKWNDHWRLGNFFSRRKQFMYGFVRMTYSLILFPSWELTYPLRRYFWVDDFLFSGGICLFAKGYHCVMYTYVNVISRHKTSRRRMLTHRRAGADCIPVGELQRQRWWVLDSLALTILTWLSGKSTRKV